MNFRTCNEVLTNKASIDEILRWKEAGVDESLLTLSSQDEQETTQDPKITQQLGKEAITASQND
jgi:hypothetical protein